MNNNYERPFSIAMSVYCNDNPVFFDRALKSIIVEQSVKPNEIVLVCDGLLTNKLDEVISRYEKNYPVFKIIRLPENKGLGNALRVATEEASNELIARMDSDDVSLPNRFEQQLCFFANNPFVDIVGGDITEFINEECNIIGKRSVPQTDKKIKAYMKKRSAFNHVSVMYKKKSVLNAGGYVDWFWNEDYYLWIRMQLNNAIFANTGTVLVNVRVGEEMYQRRGGLKYFISELKIQQYMYRHKMIGACRFISNIIKRMIVQLLLPNQIRAWVFKKFAREHEG